MWKGCWHGRVLMHCLAWNPCKHTPQVLPSVTSLCLSCNTWVGRLKIILAGSPCWSVTCLWLEKEYTSMEWELHIMSTNVKHKLSFTQLTITLKTHSAQAWENIPRQFATPLILFPRNDVISDFCRHFAGNQWWRQERRSRNVGCLKELESGTSFCTQYVLGLGVRFSPHRMACMFTKYVASWVRLSDKFQKQNG